MSAWKDIVKTVAPGLAGLLTGGNPLAVMAVRELSSKLLGKDDAAEDEIAAAVSSAGPETLLKIKEAERDLKLGLAQVGIRLEELAAGDRTSARQREVATGDKTVQRLAWLYTLAYFATLWAVWRFGLPADADTRAMLFTLIGVLTAAQAAIMNYYFGSSAGSAAKNHLLATKP